MKLRMIYVLGLLCLSAGAAFGQSVTLSISTPNPSTRGDNVQINVVTSPTFPLVTLIDTTTNTTLGTAQASSTHGIVVAGDFRTSSLGVGIHQIVGQASFGVDVGQTITSSPVTQTVKPIPNNSVSLTSSANPSTLNQAVTFTASVSPVSTSCCSATGSVTFKSDGVQIGGNVTLVDGSASVAYSGLTAGNHTITASYSGDANFASGSTQIPQTVTKPTVNTALLLTSSPNPSCGGPVTFTATITPSSATGSVTFFDGTATLSTVPLSGGSASYTAALTAGTHQVQARYNPDQGYGGSSNSLAQVVNAGSVAVTVNSSPNPSTVNQTVVVTATVTPLACPGGAPPPTTPPTGTVVFFDNTTQIGLAALASGIATISTSTLTIGNHPLNAQYNGDSNYSPSRSPSETQVVNPGTPTNTTTALTTSANPITTAQSLTLTANVTPLSGTGTPTGQVQFKDGANPIGTAALSGGTASFTVPALTAGTHSLSAFYVGDNNFSSSTSNVITENVTVPTPTKANTVTALMTSAVSITTAQSLALTASVTPPGATGQVQFNDGANTIGAATLSGGSASYTVPNLTAGSHTLSAVYVGDANFNPSSSTTVNVTVTTPNTSTALSVNPNPANAGQTVTLSAAVTPSNAPGSVQFFDGAMSLGSNNVVGGTATLQVSTFGAGSHTLTARYLGDSVNAPSTSNPASLTVNKQNTTTSLTTSSNPVNNGQSLTLNAIVTPAGATGQVQFSDGGGILATVSLNGGTASYATSSLSTGTHSLSASYLGDGNFNPSTSQTISQSVSPIVQQTSTNLSVVPNSANLGQAVTMNAVVTPASATGTVMFSDNGSALGSAQLGNGSASFTTNTLPAGAHRIVATYGGTGTFSSSSSSPVTLTVNTSATQTTLSAAPTTSTFGQTVVLNASVTAVNGGSPTGTVTFSEGDNTLGVSNLAGGSASCPTATLAVGSHSLIASYSGDNTFTQSSSLPINVQVNKAPTSTVLTPTPTSSSPGQGVQLTARVTPSTATGTVTFMDGTVAISAPVTVAGGSASTTIASLPPGTHLLTAVYSGDSNYLASTSPSASESLGLTGTATALSVSPGSSNFGQSVALTATVTPAAATGTVTFLDGTTSLGTGSVSNGIATLSTSNLSPGPHSLTAVYSGDSKFATSASTPPAILTVGPVTSSTSLSTSPNPSLLGQQVILRATVTPATASGTVTFLNGNITLGSSPVSNGTAGIVTSALTSGSNSLTASYSGDTFNTPSTSVAVTQTVNPTATALANISPAALPTAIVGVPYSQTFTVAGGAAPMTWSLAEGSVPGLTLSPAGVLSGTPGAAGTNSLTVKVTDTNNSAAAAVLSLTVLPLPSVSISAPTVSSTADQPAPQAVLSPAYTMPLIATFALSFTPNAASLPPNYSNPDVKFIGGSTTSGPVPIPANMAAPVMLPALQVGTVAGTITVRLATLTTSAGQSVLPTNPPTTTITVDRFAPAIVPGSVKITNITSAGFTVSLDGISTPRDLTSANLTFTAASGTQLNGAQATISLASAAAAWFPDTGDGRGVASGGSFSLTIPFNYSGDTSAIGSVSVTLTNSAGTSSAVSGER